MSMSSGLGSPKKKKPFRTHYDNLKVARNAPDTVIRAAYKALIQRYHPDRFEGRREDAEKICKIINRSYAILSDPIRRREHDAWISEQEEVIEYNDLSKAANTGSSAHGATMGSANFGNDEAGDPAHGDTAACDQEKAQVRESQPQNKPKGVEAPSLEPILPNLIGFILALGFSGAVYESHHTNLYVPTTIILTVWFLWIAYKLMIWAFSGFARSKWWRYILFATIAVLVARSLIRGLFPPNQAVSNSSGSAESYYRVMSESPAVMPAGSNSKPSPNSLSEQYASAPELPWRHFAPNGQPWPYEAGYVPGYPVDFTAGNSEILVDNSKNDSPVHVRIVKLVVPSDFIPIYYIARNIYIPANRIFLAVNLDAGTFDIRYRDLN